MMTDLHTSRPIRRRRHLGRWTPVLVLLFALAAPAVQAQVVINVTTTTDELNNNNGDCSLREAISEAGDFNTASEGDCTDGNPGGTGYVINLPAGTYTLSLAGTGEDNNATGDLDLRPQDGPNGFGEPLTIRASGGGSATIDANGIDRVFDLQQVGNGSSYTATFERLF